MSNYSRASQSGAVVSFVIIGIVLVAIVASAIYVFRDRSDDGQPTPASSDSPLITPEPIASDVPVRPTDSAPDQPSESTVRPPEGDASLPTTGPTDLLQSGVVIAVLVAAVTSYVGSRAELSKR